MSGDSSAHFLRKIGELLLQSSESSSDILMYTRAATGMVSISIFKDFGTYISYQDDLGILADTVLDFWEDQPPGRQWDEMEYTIRNGKFEANFIYSDQIDPQDDGLDRRDRAVARVFGSKTIVYPSWDDVGDVFKL